MTIPVTLHVRTEPFEDEYEDDDGYLVPVDGTKVIGEVKRGDDILFKKEGVTDNGIESVCGLQDDIALDIEIWAVENTDRTHWRSDVTMSLY